MIWNLRLVAANHGIWKASEMQRRLAGHGLVISAGKMSGLWSGTPASLKLDDLDVICAVLGCGIEELLIPQPETVTPAHTVEQLPEAADGGTRRVRPRNRGGRSLPPM
jgi:DNA-binding Xre family transcriptional regulator